MEPVKLPSNVVIESPPSLMSDLEETNEEYNLARTRILGFRPQKENSFNKLLPYAEDLDHESQEMLTDIKCQLAKSVLLKELKPGCTVWCLRLQKYIQMFGLKFSKEDHILFIKLIFELLTIPNLEPLLISRFSTCLTWLLKKKELVSREELILPWKPLFNIYDRLMCSSNSCIGLYRFSPNTENALADLLIVARVYFESSATQEMLEQWRPQLCPFDSVAIQNAMELLDTFLPTVFLPQETSLGYKLWLDEFMDLWKTCHNAPVWEPHMMSIISRVASHNVGHIDWEPHMALMYTRILRNFNLPVNFKKMKVNKAHKLSTSAVTVWIVATLGGGSSSQTYLTRMMKVMESYFHPANVGTWVARLREFLRKITHHFIHRLNLERHHKPSWLPSIPERARLTEEDITLFVDCMAPSVKLAMYSRVASEISLPLQYLATLRPNIVIPPIIESMYNTLDSLTEPHKYTAAMLSLVSVARPMIEPNDYKEGPTHVIPLLMAILPGIDPNDIRKCFITFQVLTTFTAMIPLVDCSGASEHWKDLTEEEEIVCAATSQLEDLVLEFMDRCFTLVDNSVLENTRLEQQDQHKQVRSRMENVAESAIVSTFSCLLYQTSPQIFKSALRKLHTFVTSRILETTVSGKSVGSICRTFAKVRPEETLKLLLPHFCQIILAYGDHEDIKQEENLDNELLYNLLLLSEVVNCYGKFIIGYGELLEKVLDLTLHLKCCEGYTLASKLLNNILSAVSVTKPQDFKSSNENYGKPISEYLPVRDWGRSYQTKDLAVEWYTPSEKEVKYVEHLIAKYLVPELYLIEAYSKDKHSFTREELQCSLSIVTAFLGCGRLLPIWDEPPVAFKETVADRKNFVVRSAFKEIVSMPDGSNVRKTIALVMGQLQTKLLSCADTEDDTKSLISIANIWGLLLMNLLPSCEEFEAQSKALLLGRKIYENKMLGKKRHIRSILVNRAYHQHETIIILSVLLRTATHVKVFDHLLELCTSHYSDVRKNAQGKLNYSLRLYSDNSMLISKLLDILKRDSNIHHEQIKGALYVLLGPKDHPLVIQREWGLLKQLWPALVQAQPSEKPSVINLLNALSDTVRKHFHTLNIDIQIGEKGEEVCKKLWKTSNPTPNIPIPSSEDIISAQKRLNELNERNKADYLELLDTLGTCINSNLHWRHHSLALNFLLDLGHPDCAYPPHMIRHILHTLVHDNIEFRKVAIRCTIFVLKQQKRKHNKQCVVLQDSSSSGRVPYGDRDDNQWLQYNSSTVPRSPDAWDQPRYVHNQYVSYYDWPKELKVYSPSQEQPPLDRTREELSAGEREVDDFFSDPRMIDKLMSFFSLEDKKGKDKFNGMRFILFKNLFRNSGDKYVEFFKPHLERLIADKQESNQRCAAEIITGMIRGAKHWPYEKVQHMWDYLLPLLRTAFTNMTVETVNDWSVMAATASENRDPNRHHWLLEFLMEDPLRQESSFIDCGRLSALQGALNQQEWRVVELFNRLLDYLSPKLSHPYQLLRERIGSVLTNIFALDLPTVGARRTRGPQIAKFVAGVMPQLQCLYSLSEASTNNHRSDSKEETMQVDQASGNQMSENGKNTALCLLKTMVKWITNSVVRADYSAIPEFFAFLPLVSVMENYEADDELNKICAMMLTSMAQSLTLPEFVSTALAAIKEVSEMSSWSARATCLEFLQVFVFHNMATIASQDVWVSQVNNLVLRLLKDDRVEVREKAGQVLSGLIHCGFISDTNLLLGDLKRLAAKQKSHASDVAKRHAGVLGLCAFISANPYDVVDPVPEIFLMLGRHLNDPQPIPSSIRKTLGDFKRTHHDNWEQHKQKFTEEQLAVLTDLIVPPSYYA
ncbi:proteasome activator complex subunit 4-like [Macrosteles quadrilineatus]|uniref:proteasome activator complex subunit 4-like n=1 Tax=Macrosteles quadrilineatus TaxID=74068 RepID=UPI0023E20588|nr:proteasome activator complex subunit 4-like [Macrosteles quadrilineatus]